MNRPTDRGAGIKVAVLIAVLALVVSPVSTKEPAKAIQAETEIPEHLLLDVGIQLFGPGLPEDDETALEDKGIFAGVRRAEARFLPFHLKNSLEATGQWGAVRVLPTGAEIVDVLVTGTILASTGMELIVVVRVVDSRGRVWREKRYKQQADPFAYMPESLDVSDPYQGLYNQIANDMVKARDHLDEDEVLELRELSRMRFASDLAPAAFGEYLTENKKGRWTIERLPAEDDAMVARIGSIRERDEMFVDTLNEYYAEFYANMRDPYDNWRTYSFEEQKNLQEVRRKARTRKIVGGLLLLGAAFADGGTSAARAARDAAAIGGAVTLKSGIDIGKEAKIHREALKELAASFDAEMAPLVIDVEGHTLRLEGSAETQYSNWRAFLTLLFNSDVGLFLDADTGLPETTTDRPPQ